MGINITRNSNGYDRDHNLMFLQASHSSRHTNDSLSIDLPNIMPNLVGSEDTTHLQSADVVLGTTAGQNVYGISQSQLTIEGNYHDAPVVLRFGEYFRNNTTTLNGSVRAIRIFHQECRDNTFNINPDNDHAIRYELGGVRNVFRINGGGGPTLNENTLMREGGFNDSTFGSKDSTLHLKETRSGGKWDIVADNSTETVDLSANTEGGSSFYFKESSTKNTAIFNLGNSFGGDLLDVTEAGGKTDTAKANTIQVTHAHQDDKIKVDSDSTVTFNAATGEITVMDASSGDKVIFADGINASVQIGSNPVKKLSDYRLENNWVKTQPSSSSRPSNADKKDNSVAMLPLVLMMGIGNKGVAGGGAMAANNTPSADAAGMMLPLVLMMAMGNKEDSEEDDDNSMLMMILVMSMMGQQQSTPAATTV